jgi:hypothetical protein
MNSGRTKSRRPRAPLEVPLGFLPSLLRNTVLACPSVRHQLSSRRRFDHSVYIPVHMFGKLRRTRADSSFQIPGLAGPEGMDSPSALASKSTWDLFGAHCVGLACSLRLPFGCPQPPAPGGWNVTSRRACTMLLGSHEKAKSSTDVFFIAERAE